MSSDHYPITIPEGLNEMLQEFALAVLRKKPEDLIDYAAFYFNDLKQRTHKGSSGTEVREMEVAEQNNSLLPGLPADPSLLLKVGNGDSQSDGEMDTHSDDGE